ncbi:MAG: hypothetical protein A3K03_13695 [Bdellovibrionales bacterium RIFOXYD1_FULL_44_7]|nr:MAG: hypothetical protein A3K03_13695 [Bdellovibrionales bacterium RIFOXYD1_FULL_44_7]
MTREEELLIGRLQLLVIIPKYVITTLVLIAFNATQFQQVLTELNGAQELHLPACHVISPMDKVSMALRHCQVVLKLIVPVAIAQLIANGIRFSITQPSV